MFVHVISEVAEDMKVEGGGTIAVCVSTEQLGGSGSSMFLIRCSEIASEALLGKELPIEYHPPPICILFSFLLVC